MLFSIFAVISGTIFLPRTWVYLPGDIITKKGELCKEFFYINKGKVRLTDLGGNNNKVLMEGECFNELSFVFESIVLNTVIADDFCILDVLTREGYNEIIEKMPDISRDIKSGLKNAKVEETKIIVETVHKMPFFADFTEDEIKYFYKEYMDVIYLNPNTLITGPSKKCNALYFILQGTVNKYNKSDENYEFVKTKVLDDEINAKEDYDTFVQQVDFLERKKRLEETKASQILKRGDWMGSKIFLQRFTFFWKLYQKLLLRFDRKFLRAHIRIHNSSLQ